MYSLEKDLLERKMTLRDIVECYNHWTIAAIKHRFDLTPKAEDDTQRYLESIWGPKSKAEYNYSNLELRCFGPNGEFILIKDGKIC